MQIAQSLNEYCAREPNELLLFNMGCNSHMIIVYFQFQLSDVEEHADEASLSPLKTHFL